MGHNPECPEKIELLELIKSAGERFAALKTRQREAVKANRLDEVESLESLRRRELNIKADLEYAYLLHVNSHYC